MKKEYQTKIQYTSELDFEDALINAVCKLCDEIANDKKKEIKKTKRGTKNEN